MSANGKPKLWRERGRRALSYRGIADDPRLTGWPATTVVLAFGSVVVTGVGILSGIADAAIAAVIFAAAAAPMTPHLARTVERWPIIKDAALPVASVLTVSITLMHRSEADVLIIYGAALVAALVTASIVRRSPQRPAH